MISLIQFFSSSVLLKQEKTEQEIPDKKTINKEYWKVAFPAAIEGVLLNLMLLADLIMVGMLGIEKAAAVGIVSQPKMILQMIVSAAGVAITAIVARRKGEGDEEGLNSCIKQSLLLLGLLYFLFVCLIFIFSKNIFITSLLDFSAPSYITVPEILSISPYPEYVHPFFSNIILKFLLSL